MPPVFTAIVQFLLARQWPKRLWWIGSVMALAGVATLILGRNLAGGGNAPSLVGDPSFNAPVYANLFDDEDGEGYSLIWSRPNGRRGD